MRVELKVSDIDSSLVSRIEYLWSDEELWELKKEGHLRVTFQNGFRYIYEKVPFILVMNIISDKSAGEAFSHFIKHGGYKYYKD